MTSAYEQQKQMSDETKHILSRTTLCKFHLRGHCKKGDDCSHAHGEGALLPRPNLTKTKLCWSFMRSGHCNGGSDCSFAHGRSELRPAEPSQNSSRGTCDAALEPDLSSFCNRQSLDMHNCNEGMSNFYHSQRQLQAGTCVIQSGSIKPIHVEANMFHAPLQHVHEQTLPTERLRDTFLQTNILRDSNCNVQKASPSFVPNLDNTTCYPMQNYVKSTPLASPFNGFQSFSQRMVSPGCSGGAASVVLLSGEAHGVPQGNRIPLHQTQQRCGGVGSPWMQPGSAAQSLTVPVVGGNIQHQLQCKHSQSMSQMPNQQSSFHSWLDPSHFSVQGSENTALLQNTMQPQGFHVRDVSNAKAAQCQVMPCLSGANVEANLQLYFDQASIDNSSFQPVPVKLEHHLHASQASPGSQVLPSGAGLSAPSIGMTCKHTRISWCPSLSFCSESDATPARSSRCRIESEGTHTFRVKNTFIDFEDSTFDAFVMGRSFSK